MANEYRIRVRGEGDFSHLVGAARRAADQIYAASQRSLQRAGAQAAKSGTPLTAQQLAAREGSARTRIRQDVAAGTLTIREGAAVQAAVRSLFNDLHRQLSTAIGAEIKRPARAQVIAATRLPPATVAAAAAAPAASPGPKRKAIQDRAAAEAEAGKALGGARSKAKGRGGVISLEDVKGLTGETFPDEAQIRALQSFLDRPDLNDLLRRHGRYAVKQRNIGLRVGQADEEALAAFQNTPIHETGATPNQLRTGLTLLRRRREYVEEANAIEAQLNEVENAVLFGEKRRLNLGRERRKRREVRDLSDGRTGADLLDQGDLQARERRRRVARDRIAEQRVTEADAVNEGQLAADVRRRARTANEAKRSATDLQAEAREANAIRAYRRRQRDVQSELLGLPSRGSGARGAVSYVFDQSKGGTRTQRVETLLSAGRGGVPRPPDENSTLGQLFSGGLLTSAKFAASGAVLYGIFSTISDLVGEAERLNRVMLIVEEQFRNTANPEEFREFRSEILGISRDTGVLADEVATVGFQMKGAFGQTQRAIEETRGAFKVSVVTGLEQRELTDSLTAGAKAYGTSIEEIGDKAIGLEERFGVLARESLKVFGDLASVANSAGLDLNELGAIVGVIQQASGRGHAAIAEGLGRVFPAIGEQAVAIAQLYRQIPGLIGNAGQVIDALAAGRTGDVLLQLARDYQNLDKATQQYVVTLLGGRREAQLLDPLFANSRKLVDELTDGLDDGGKTSKRFDEIQKSATQTVKRFREELRQFGDALARGGLLDAFLVFAGGAELLVKTLGAGVRLFGDLNDAAGGIPAKLVAIALGIKAIEVAIASMGRVRAAGGLAPAVVQGVVNAAGYNVGPNAAAAAGANASGAAAGGIIARRVAAAQAGRVAAQSAAGAGAGFLGSSSRLAGFAGGAFGAIGIGAPAVIAASAAATGYAYKNNRDYVRKRSDELAQTLADATQDRLREMLAENEVDFWERIGAAMFGKDNTDEAIERELRKRSPKSKDLQERLTAYNDLYGNGEDNSITDLLAALKRGDSGAVGDAEALYLGSIRDPKEKKRFETALKAYRQKKAQEAKAAAVTPLPTFVGAIETLESVQAAFEAGEVGFDKLISVQREQVEILDKTAGSDPERLKQLAAARRTLNKTIADSVTGSIQIVQEMIALTRGGDDALAALPTLNAALDQLRPRTIKATSTLPKGAFGQAGFDPQSAFPAADVVIPGDPIAAKEVADVYAQIRQEAFQRAIKNAKSADEALALARGGVTLDPAVRQAYIDYQIARFGKVLFAPPEKLTADQDQIEGLIAQQLQERIGGLQSANRDVIDPLKNAQLGAQIAKLTLDAALLGGRRAEIDSANIAYAQAQRAVLEQQQAVFDSQHEFAVAVAEKAGDTVRAAQLALDQVNVDISRAEDQGAGEAVINQLQARRVNAEASKRDAALAEAIRQVDVDLALERASTGNAIARLSDIPNAIVDLTQQQKDELAIKIKGLRDQAGEFKLNAGDIKLPTLYEVRRLSQSEQQGIGYMDNRQVDIKLYVNSEIDLQKVEAIMGDALGRSNLVLADRPRAY